MTEVLNSILVLLGECGWSVKLGPLPLTIIQQPGMGPRCPPVAGVSQVALMQVDHVVADTLRNSMSLTLEQKPEHLSLKLWVLCLYCFRNNFSNL